MVGNSLYYGEWRPLEGMGCADLPTSPPFRTQRSAEKPHNNSKTPQGSCYPPVPASWPEFFTK